MAFSNHSCALDRWQVNLPMRLSKEKREALDLLDYLAEMEMMAGKVEKVFQVGPSSRISKS